VILCIAGALFINRPLAPAPGCPAVVLLLPVGAALFWSLMNLVVRRCGHVPPPIIAAFTDATAILLACGAALLKARGHLGSAAELLLPRALDSSFCMACVAAVAGWGGTQCNIAGYQRVTVAAVAAVAGSTSVPFNYAVQVFAFGEAPDNMAVLGAALVVAANLASAVGKWRASAGAGSDAAATDRGEKSEAGRARTVVAPQRG